MTHHTANWPVKLQNVSNAKGRIVPMSMQELEAQDRAFKLDFLKSEHGTPWRKKIAAKMVNDRAQSLMAEIGVQHQSYDFHVLAFYRWSSERYKTELESVNITIISNRNRLKSFLQRHCDEYLKASWGEISSKRRSRRVVMARHVVFYLYSRFTDYSLPEIGRRVGSRDHTTVLHGIRAVRYSLGQETQSRQKQPKDYKRLVDPLLFLLTPKMVKDGK